MPIEEAAAAARAGEMDVVYHMDAETLARVLHKVDQDNRTLVHVVACTGDVDLLAFVLERGGKDLINHQDDEGWTALHSATSCAYVETAQLLLANGAKASGQTKQGRNSLHYAASKGCAEIIPDLLTHGADPNQRDCTGATPLHRAAGTGSLEAARMLVEHGSAKVDAKDKLGETPLALACRGNHRAVALYLVHKGADVEAEDVDGETPLGLAAPFAHLRQDLADLALKKKTIQDFGLH